MAGSEVHDPIHYDEKHAGNRWQGLFVLQIMLGD